MSEIVMKRSPASGKPGSPHVAGFYESHSGSIQYVVWDPETKKAALIDVVLDFDPGPARTRTDSADNILKFVRDEGLEVDWVLDTHPHADHLMASAYLKEQTGAPNAIGEKVDEISAIWAKLYNLPGHFDPKRDFDRLFAEGETFRIGNLEAKVMLSAGHTLGSITYVVGDAAFVHDTFMNADVGTSRADFPGGDTETLWNSLQAILALPDDTRLFVGHDYGAPGRDGPAWEATVGEHKASNPHLAGKTREEFIEIRDKRDATLELPDRILHALQVNLRGGRLPEPEDDGNRYFKIPANRFPRRK